jgi:hypothetical protein
MCRKFVYLILFVLLFNLAGYASAAVDATIPAGSPTLDGVQEAAWSESEEHKCLYTIMGDPASDNADLSASWRALWDTEYLYLFVDVNDEDLRNDQPLEGESWNDDSVEILIDIGNDDLTEYGEDDEQYRVAWGTWELESYWHGNYAGIEIFVLTKNVGSGVGGRGDGYTIEIKFPWETLDVNDRGLTTLGDLLGIEVQVNDDDDGGSQDTQISWYNNSGDAWRDPSQLGTVELVPSLKAYNPIPKNNAVNVNAALLQWSAGKHADDTDGHRVYFDTTKANVQARSDCDVNGVSRTEPNYLATLEPITTYYWAIDEVNAQGPPPYKWEGDVWQFTTAPATASEPVPPNDSKWIDYDQDLGWTAGFYANKHDIYFGTVNPPPLKQSNWGTTTYEPGTLLPGATYYWAIDEVNEEGPDPCKWEGDTWNFTTLSAGAGIKAEWYTNANLLYNPTLITTEYSINFDWGQGSPQAGIPVENWSVRFTTELECPVTATYTFTTTRAPLIDGIRLYINGQLLISRWESNENPGDEPFSDSVNIDLNAGLVPVVLEFYDSLQAAKAILKWDYGQGEEVIPRDQFYLPRRAASPNPGPGAIDVGSTPVLSWTRGMYAATHDIYFSTDETAVTNANKAAPLGVLVEEGIATNTTVTYDIAADPNVGILAFNTTYYWKIGDVNLNTIPYEWYSPVWSFTTDGYHEVENFERYQSPAITDVWKEPVVTGATIATSSSTAFKQFHTGTQAMAYSYDNSAAPNYSEAYAKTGGGSTKLKFGKNWRLQDVKALSLWFRGRDLRGSFTGLDPYNIEADGIGLYQIKNDYCYFIYTYVAGQRTGEVVARVDTMDNTNTWAMSGVMIRQSLADNAIYGAVVVTPSTIVLSYRGSAGSTSSVIYTGTTPIAASAPYWVKVGYAGTIGNYRWHAYCAEPNEITGYHDNKWLEFVSDQVAPMLAVNIYLGVCVTSRSYGEMCNSKISNVGVTSPPGTAKADPSTGVDIGKAYNNPEKMYVALKDNAGHNVTIYYPGTTNPASADPCVVMLNDWTQWRIDLNDYMDGGIDVCDVNSIYIGFGNRGAPVAGGSGMMFIDDIALYTAQFYEPECPPWPPDLARDGSIDDGDLGVMADNWLIEDYNVTPVPPPNEPILVAWYRLEGNANDYYGVHNGTAVGSPTYTAECREGSQAIDLDGIDDYIGTDSNAIDYGIDSNNPRTITAWVYTRDFIRDIAGIYEIGQDEAGREFSLIGMEEPNQWRAQYWGGPTGWGGSETWDIDFTYPSLNTWVHFAHTYDGTTAKVYADGYLVAERALALDTGSKKTFKIGWWSFTDAYFNGIIDDVRIYNCALSQGNVAYIAGKTSEYIQPLQWLLTPPNPDINLYVEDPNTNRNRINFKDLAELGNAWGDTQIWPTW